MKKKLLSTLAAVSTLSTLVTPVLAAPPSHESTSTQTHYSFATGYEGNVREANFLKDSYDMQNGDTRDFLDDLMAFVNDDLLAHQLDYVEWYIENHDSNYPFSLASSTEGDVYCGFDSGTATLTAVITRDDGSLVKASTKLVANARTLAYASGFSITSSETFYTGVEAIKNGEITITPTPDNTVFSQAQYNQIREAIMVDGDLDIFLRYGNNVATTDDTAYQIKPTISGFNPDPDDAAEVWNGFSGEKSIKVSYPLGESNVTNYENYASSGSASYEVGSANTFWAVTTDSDGYYTGNGGSGLGTARVTIGGVEIKATATNGTMDGGDNFDFFKDVVSSLNASSLYSATSSTGHQYTNSANGGNAILTLSLHKGSDDFDDILDDLNDYAADGDVGYAVDYTNYTLTYTGKGYTAELIDDGVTAGAAGGTVSLTIATGMDPSGNGEWLLYNSGTGSAVDYGTAFTTGASDPGLSSTVPGGTTYSTVNALLEGVFAKRDFTFKDSKGEGKFEDLTLVVSEKDAETYNDTQIVNALANYRLYIADGSDNNLSKSETVTDNNKPGYYNDYVSFKAGTSKIWGVPSNYTQGDLYTHSGDVNDNGLRAYPNAHGTTAYNYTLSVANFPRYTGTVQVDVLDDVSRTTRIDTANAVQPDSLHQTSSITVAVGDIVDLESHFKPTSTANTWNDFEYNEEYFNNDSSYAYNDYGVITDEDEILGVRVGKNKVVATVWNSYDQKYHSAEVIVTVVPRTSTSTTVTPTLNPLSVVPSTHTTTLGGAGVQLAAYNYGENTNDVNDNILPTLQSDDNGKITDKLEWVSNDPTVLTVSADGFVTPVGVGTGTVTVKVPNSDYEAVFTMTVIAPTIPQEEGSTSTTPVPSTGVNALGQLF